MKRQSLNYVDNCLRDIREGTKKVENISRIGDTDDFIAAACNLRIEVELMVEGVQAIESQQELEV